MDTLTMENNTDLTYIKEDNSRREAARRARIDAYDPMSGLGAGGQRATVAAPDGSLQHVPVSMLGDKAYAAALKDNAAWQRLRCRHDFEYWAVRCVKVHDKTTGRDVAFRLNSPQRRVAAVLESDRRAGRPIRLILLKARQWGGSTLIQMYMAWIQSCHRRNWHSLICAHVKDTAANIRGMYTKMLSSYPEELWEGDAPPQFKAYERALNIREIAGRGCRVTLGSSEAQESVRGSDYAMAHLSETAFWCDSNRKSPHDFIRAINGAVARAADTLVAVESTANGVGNYFHREWLRCQSGTGDKHAVFIAWYDIDAYSSEVDDIDGLWHSLTAYERALWDRGLTLGQIKWYHDTRLGFQSDEHMYAEFPTTPEEAFINTGKGVFATAHVERLRPGCRKARMRGDIGTLSGRIEAQPDGPLQVWESPEEGEQYVVAVDVGGRSEGSDWSVIAVLSRGERPRVVAQWRGHIDHDMLARKSVWLARHYNEALLVIESNTLETEAAGDPNMFVLSRLADEYGNLYRRRLTDTNGMPLTPRVGFHTNRSTKSMLIGTLIEMLREAGYEERDETALNEYLTYEQLPNGSYAARESCHDDCLMTRAIALYVHHTEPLQPTYAGFRNVAVW